MRIAPNDKGPDQMRRRALIGFLEATDLAVMVVAFAVAFVMSGKSMDAGSVEQFLAVRVKLANFIWFAAFVLAWHLLFRWGHLYASRRPGLITSEWWNTIKAVSVGALLLSGLALSLDLTAVNRVFLAHFFLVALLGTITARAAIRGVFGEGPGLRGRNLKNLIIVGCGSRAAELGREVRRNLGLGYFLVGYIDDIEPPENPLHGGPEKLLGPLSQARRILSSIDVDEIAILLPIRSRYDAISDLISICEELNVVVHVPADFFDVNLVHTEADALPGTPVLTLRGRDCPAATASLKRAIDVLGSAFALLVLSPFLALIALAVRLDSPGPVLFLQQRIGMKGKAFRMVKFRTMHVGAEREQSLLEHRNEASGAAFKIRDDPRVTRLGRILRNLSLDEVPQFWNVLIGDMSLVGPRPLPQRDVERFDCVWQQRRFSVKPGMTCLWQINGRHEVGFEHWMELDLQYIDSWSLTLDFDILAKTLPAVLRRTGAS